MGLLNIGRYAADTPDPAPSGRFVSHPNVVNRLADAYRRRPYSNTITARPMYAIAPTGEQNDIREERGGNTVKSARRSAPPKSGSAATRFLCLHPYAEAVTRLAAGPTPL